jgi:UDP-N-acetylmuramoylalanine--D-glutamate ligase
MRHRISWSDLRGQRVGLWGLGTEGRASLRKLRALGVEPVIVDDAPPPGAEAILVTSAGGADALAGCDVVVKSPGISRHRPEVVALEAAGVAVVGGLGLWLEDVDRSRVVCVTGTKGKSTTSSIMAHLATGLGVRAFVGGNLGTPPYDPDAPTDADLFVIETSSYQSTDLASSPPIVAVTSLYPDHLDWHGDESTYLADKLSLCTRPGARLTVANATSPLLVEHSGSLGPEVMWVDDSVWPGDWAEPLGLLGHHNRIDAALARTCLHALGVDGANDDDRVRTAAVGFARLESRLQFVGAIGGVDFVDDGLSTNVLATIAAMDAFEDRRVALIAGGYDRGIDYRDLAEALSARGQPTSVMAVYSTGPRIRAAIEDVSSARVSVRSCVDLTDAVDQAWRWARPDGVVLLSPAAASFDAFDDYRHRSRVFRDAIASVTRS